MKRIYEKEKIVCIHVHKTDQNRNITTPLAEGLFLTDNIDKADMVAELRESITTIIKDKHTQLVEEVRKEGRVLSFWVLDKEDGNYNFIGNYST